VLRFRWGGAELVGLSSLLLLLAWPGRADALPVTFEWPFFGGSAPMCVGVQVAPIWGDHGDYTGHCRYGAPLGQMQAAIQVMDRRRAVGSAEEGGLSQSFGDKLSTELSNIAGLPTVQARARLKRDAKKGRRSWTARAAASCAMFGAMGAGLITLYDLVRHHQLDGDGIAQGATGGCTAAVLTPALNKWLKTHGFDLED
jgi:hypothetical protein